ncbi:hypothetical protein K474DRAFT_1512397 [Panus rudis PR-1116 ss-1]|nr:hypothetical protein K474DRAFT_1512397 [Panus rudis PR-1116 ss-1]
MRSTMTQRNSYPAAMLLCFNLVLGEQHWPHMACRVQLKKLVYLNILEANVAVLGARVQGASVDSGVVQSLQDFTVQSLGGWTIAMLSSRSLRQRAMLVALCKLNACRHVGNGMILCSACSSRKKTTDHTSICMLST